MTPIGYFRSHIREGLCLSDQDRELIEQNLQDPNAVFLVIRPYEMGVCVAGFFFWQDGHLQGNFSDLEVPFVPNEAAILERQSPAPQPTVVSAAPEPIRSPEPERMPVAHIPAPSVAAQPPQPPQPSAASPRPNRLWPYLWKLALACVLLAFAGAGTYFGISALRTRQQAAANTPPATQIGLRVENAAGGQLNLSWNRSLPELANMQRAKLTILDGSVRRELAVDEAQLRSGKLTYFPTGSDIQFQLEIYLPGSRSVAESMRVVLPAAPGLRSEPVVVARHVIETPQPAVEKAVLPPVKWSADVPAPPFTAKTKLTPLVRKDLQLGAIPAPQLSAGSVVQLPPAQIPQVPAYSQTAKVNQTAAPAPVDQNTIARKTTPDQPLSHAVAQTARHSPEQEPSASLGVKVPNQPGAADQSSKAPKAGQPNATPPAGAAEQSSKVLKAGQPNATPPAGAAEQSNKVLKAGQPNATPPAGAAEQSNKVLKAGAAERDAAAGAAEQVEQGAESRAAERDSPAARPSFEYVAPVIAREVRPSVPLSVHGLITTEQELEVNVDIDDKGKVIRTRLAGSKGALAGMLARSVLDAAHEYRFTPARRDGVRVTQQHDIEVSVQAVMELVLLAAAIATYSSDRPVCFSCSNRRACPSSATPRRTGFPQTSPWSRRSFPRLYRSPCGASSATIAHTHSLPRQQLRGT